MKELVTNQIQKDPLIEHKRKWEALAEENDRYYVRSVDHEQTDEEYELSGLQNVTDYIVKCPVVHKHIFPFSDKAVLEIGCGSGRITKSLSRFFNHVYAIDISQTMLLKAQNFVSSSNVSFIESDGTTVPVALGSADFAFSYIVYQHFPSREAVRASFEGVNRALKCGGIFKAQVRGLPNPDKNHWSWGPDYDEAQASDLALETGFEIISLTGAKTRSFWLLLRKRT